MSSQTRATTNQITHKGEVLSDYLDGSVVPDDVVIKDEEGGKWRIAVDTQGVLSTVKVN